MKTKLQQLNLTYVRDNDGLEWLFIPSDDNEWKTSHNGCYCLSEENTYEPYFNPKSGHVMTDFEIDQIRPSNTYEIDSFIEVMDYYNYTINESNKLEKIK